MNARKIILYLVLLVVAANLALVAVVFMGTLAVPSGGQPLPKPNGHDDFVRAEKMLTTKPDAYKGINLGQLNSILATNAPAMSLVRTGLGRECRVPLDDLKINPIEHMEELNDFKLVVFAFSAEASMAQLERRTNAVAGIWVDLIRFSNDFCKGGAYVDVEVGEKGENFALTRLLKLFNSLEGGDCATVAKALEEIDGKSDSPEQVIKQNKIYTSKLTFRESFSRLLHFRQVRRSEELFANQFNEVIKQRRETMAAFAARAYELAKGKRPASLADLVPAYLKAIPKNPLTGASVDYRP